MKTSKRAINIAEQCKIFQQGVTITGGDIYIINSGHKVKIYEQKSNQSTPANKVTH
jgi:hypothetical protein